MKTSLLFFVVAVPLAAFWLLANESPPTPAPPALAVPAPASAKASWPVFRGNSALNGVASEALAAPLKLAWKFAMKGPITATAAIHDGVVFLGSNDGDFHALDLATGQELWTAKLGDNIESSACVIDGRVFVGSDDGHLYALEAKTGQQVWKYQTEGEILAGVNFARKDGKTYVYVGSYDNKLHCVDAANGQKIWQTETGDRVNGTASVAEGKVIFGGCDSVLYMVDAFTGEDRGQIKIGSYIANSVTVADGVIYVAHYGNQAEAYDIKEKKQLWLHHDREFPYFASPAVTAEHVFVANRGKRLFCLERATGKPVWEFKARRSVDSSPVVSGDLVYFGSDDGRLYAVDRLKGEEKWTYEIGKPITAAPAIAEGKLVIGSQDGSVYAFAKE